METWINFLDGNFFWIAVTLMVLGGWGFSAIRDIAVSRSRERTRREIAAYIAEGSMTPEQGERLMKIGKSMDT